MREVGAGLFFGFQSNRGRALHEARLREQEPPKVVPGLVGTPQPRLWFGGICDFRTFFEFPIWSKGSDETVVLWGRGCSPGRTSVWCMMQCNDPFLFSIFCKAGPFLSELSLNFPFGRRAVMRWRCCGGWCSPGRTSKWCMMRCMTGILCSNFYKAGPLEVFYIVSLNVFENFRVVGL